MTSTKRRDFSAITTDRTRGRGQLRNPCRCVRILQISFGYRRYDRSQVRAALAVAGKAARTPTQTDQAEKQRAVQPGLQRETARQREVKLMVPSTDGARDREEGDQLYECDAAELSRSGDIDDGERRRIRTLLETASETSARENREWWARLSPEGKEIFGVYSPLGGHSCVVVETTWDHLRNTLTDC